MRLTNDLNTFLDYIENTYTCKYDEIDLAQKGFIVLDDLMNFVILKNYVNSDNPEIDYNKIKDKAREILELLGMITNRTKIHRKDFLSLCSTFDYFSDNKAEFNLSDRRVIFELKEYLKELKDIFGCYSHRNVIAKKDMNNIFYQFKMKNDFKVLENVIGNELVDFSKFLRCIPCFYVLHLKTLESFVD